MTADLTDTTARKGWGPKRSRTVTWHDPGPSTAKGLSMAGVDYLRAIIDGTLPPPPPRNAKSPITGSNIARSSTWCRSRD